MRLQLLVFSSFLSVHLLAQPFSIIPKPFEMEWQSGELKLSSATKIFVSGKGAREAAVFFNEYLKTTQGFVCPIVNSKPSAVNKNSLAFYLLPKSGGVAGSYKVQVKKGQVQATSATAQGLFYAVQSLIQLLPLEKKSDLALPYVKLSDAPAFPYRGMHLDVGRHFFTVDFIKQYIDWMAFHKFNNFHWHLTEDQGWRIEIKKYPLLKSIAACRDQTLVGRYGSGVYDGQRYCGYYTQDQIKEIVAYAAARHINVIPEIEMPGHSTAALAAYPYLGCAKGPYKVLDTWGITDDVYCAGNDSTFVFLQNVLDEVLALFPSKYIHIGGDECPKMRWKACAQCQQRIKANGLKDEDELQSYFIQRIEKYLNGKGRNIIGWDEILEGGLAPNATVMSWRGIEGGIAAAKEKHNVIMTPGSHCYLDHSQVHDDDSLTIGGYTTVEKVYSYDVIPDELKNNGAAYVQGVQGNVWTEYMAYDTKVQYMIFPRMTALAEVAWTPKANRDINDFTNRLKAVIRRYNSWKVHYSLEHFNVLASIVPAPNYDGLDLLIQKKHQLPGSYTCVYGLPPVAQTVKTIDFAKDSTGRTTKDTVVYADDGCLEEAEIEKRIHINGNDTLSVACFVMPDEKNKRKVLGLKEWNFNVQFSKATGKKIELVQAPSPAYNNGGAFSLVNGLHADADKYKAYEWLGWSGKDAIGVIDLGKSDSVSLVSVGTLERTRSWIFPPKMLMVELSNDGVNYRSIGQTENAWPQKNLIRNTTVSFAKTTARYIRFTVKNFGKIPDNQAGAGHDAWLFIDEIAVQ
jgi:hexosaminidase